MTDEEPWNELLGHSDGEGESSDDEGGISKSDLDAAIKKVRGKITVIKMRSKLKSK